MALPWKGRRGPAHFITVHLTFRGAARNYAPPCHRRMAAPAVLRASLALLSASSASSALQFCRRQPWLVCQLACTPNLGSCDARCTAVPLSARTSGPRRFPPPAASFTCPVISWPCSALASTVQSDDVCNVSCHVVSYNASERRFQLCMRLYACAVLCRTMQQKAAFDL